MTDKKEQNIPEAGQAPQLTTMENLAVHLANLQETVNALQDKVNLLEAQAQPQILEPDKTGGGKAVMAGELKTELEKQLAACKGKIKSLLFRARFIVKKGLKITPAIDMKNPADVEGKARLGSKLTQTITLYKNCVSTLTARAVWVDVKGREPEYRVRVSITER